MTAFAQLLDATAKLQEILDTIDKLLPGAKTETDEDDIGLFREAGQIFDEIVFDDHDHRRAERLHDLLSMCRAPAPRREA